MYETRIYAKLQYVTLISYNIIHKSIYVGHIVLHIILYS